MARSSSRRPLLAAVCTIAAITVGPQRAEAQGVDVTIFGGLAYPLYDQRLTLSPANPSIPGVEITSLSTPVIGADGGAVVGGAVALEFGLIAIEGRLDSVEAGLAFSGARYDLRGTAFPFQGLTASVIASAGRFDAERISLLSVNARIRTPGPVGIVASGGLSYLPDIDVSGSVPLIVDAPGVPALGIAAALTLRGTPQQSEHRFGVNGGAGLRIGGRVALLAEVRAFYFRDYELRFGTADGPELLDDLLADAEPVRFSPVFVNAQVGVTFRF
jgi:hypothetical protein